LYYMIYIYILIWYDMTWYDMKMGATNHPEKAQLRLGRLKGISSSRLLWLRAWYR
jgi:hypothetical protein